MAAGRRAPDEEEGPTMEQLEVGAVTVPLPGAAERRGIYDV